jgi:hypothetical protein
MRRPTLPILRAFMTGGELVWQPMPTRQIFSAPPSTASPYASVLAE